MTTRCPGGQRTGPRARGLQVLAVLALGVLVLVQLVQIRVADQLRLRVEVLQRHLERVEAQRDAALQQRDEVRALTRQLRARCPRGEQRL